MSTESKVLVHENPLSDDALQEVARLDAPPHVPSPAPQEYMKFFPAPQPAPVPCKPVDSQGMFQFHSYTEGGGPVAPPPPPPPKPKCIKVADLGVPTFPVQVEVPPALQESTTHYLREVNQFSRLEAVDTESHDLDVETVSLDEIAACRRPHADNRLAVKQHLVRVLRLRLALLPTYVEVVRQAATQAAAACVGHASSLTEKLLALGLTAPAANAQVCGLSEYQQA